MIKYALVTGASKGIGKYIAIELAKRGIHLLLVARNKEQLNTLATEIRKDFGVECHYLVLDLAQVDSAQKLYNWCVEKEFSVNILVNNAGYGLSGEFTSHDAGAYQNMMQLNMGTPLSLMLQFIPLLRQQPKAYILNIVSSAAYQAVPGLGVYSASKAFMLSLTRAIRYELRKTNIAVTVVNPGATDTDFANRANIKTQKALKAAKKLNMTPEVVAKMAVKGMFAEKAEVITGFVNKLVAFGTWLLPKSFVEKEAASIYGV